MATPGVGRTKDHGLKTVILYAGALDGPRYEIFGSFTNDLLAFMEGYPYADWLWVAFVAASTEQVLEHVGPVKREAPPTETTMQADRMVGKRRRFTKWEYWPCHVAAQV